MMQAPREIDGARVLKVADLAHATPTGQTRHYRDGELQAGFAALALAAYEDESGVYLFYCDEKWNCLNDTQHEDLAAAQAQAQAEFEGVTFREP
jgi:hypothetical protein